MSNRYGHAMNHLSLSDAQKEKILQSVLTEKEMPKKILPMRYVFRIAGIAALFMITVVGVNLYRNGVLPNREQPPKTYVASLSTDVPTTAPHESDEEPQTSIPSNFDVVTAPPRVAVTTPPQTMPTPSQAADVEPTVRTESSKEESAPLTQATQAPEREKGTVEALAATEAPRTPRTEEHGVKGGSGGGGASVHKEPRSLPTGFSEVSRGEGTVTYSNGSQTIVFRARRGSRDSASGDTLVIAGKSIFVTTSGEVITSADWQEGGFHYYVTSDEGMDTETLTTLIEGMR